MKKFSLQVLLFTIVFFAIALFQIRNHIPRSAKAPPITGQFKDGTPADKDLTTQSHAPASTTLIYFFAPWCGVCKVAMGNLNNLAALTQAKIVIVALDYEKSSDVLDLITEKELSSFDLILGDEATGQAYKVDTYPTYYVLSDQGEVVTSSVGYSSTLGMLFRVWLAAASG